MKDYLPPIKEHETDDLIYVYISPKGDWQDDFVKQATDELYRRGITTDQLKLITYNYRKEQEEENRKHQLQLEQNAIETYSILKMVLIFFGAPLIFYPHFYSFGDKTVSELKRENFKRKYKQRLFLLIGGAIFWIILFRIALNS